MLRTRILSAMVLPALLRVVYAGSLPLQLVCLVLSL